MNHDDPFAVYNGNEGDQTIVKPMPGGKPTPASDDIPRSQSRAPLPTHDTHPLPPRAGLNPLENAASALLSLMMRLKNTPSHPNPDALRNRMIQEIKAFEAKARNQGISEKTVFRARYILCTALDEVVLNTPWGSASDWSEQSLLSTFHNETWGGEKFFQLLDNLIQDPAHNLDLLELMYLCLAFGFEGRYRLLDNGRARLEEQRERLYRAIRHQRGDFERELSPHWRGITDLRNPLIRYVPLWVIAAVACLLLLGIYLALSILLNRTSDPVFAALSEIRGDTVAMVKRQGPPVIAPPKPPPPPEPKLVTATKNLRKFLEPEIRQGLVEVIEQADSTTVRILGDGLFDSGSAEIKSNFRPLLKRIAEELDTVPGKVLVAGHTDSIPIRTLRFPSNWHLSKARADAVVGFMTAIINSPQRFISEGRAATEPVASNDTPQGRALNRRVDITLLARVR